MSYTVEIGGDTDAVWMYRDGQDGGGTGAAASPHTGLADCRSYYLSDADLSTRVAGAARTVFSS